MQTDGDQAVPKSMAALPFDPKLLGQLKHLLPGAKKINAICGFFGFGPSDLFTKTHDTFQFSRSK